MIPELPVEARIEIKMQCLGEKDVGRNSYWNASSAPLGRIRNSSSYERSPVLVMSDSPSAKKATQKLLGRLDDDGMFEDVTDPCIVSKRLARKTEDCSSRKQNLSSRGSSRIGVYELHVLRKIERGLQDTEEGRTTPHEDVEDRLSQWLK